MPLFKSQNMALNSAITPDGFEMGRAQVVQAEAAGVAPDVRMNPILLKPTSHVGSQVIVNGVPRGTMPAGEYFRYRKSLIPEVMAAYESLAAEYDIIVIEGAGSPAEINLRQDDIVNMGMARRTNAPVLLCGDIDRGGRVRLPLRHGEAAGAGRAGEDQAPFLNIMNEWYIRDCSRKITSVLRARGMSGKHTSNHCIYGYKKDPNDKDHWIIDEEAAEVVRRIYRMAIEGKGPYEIARILATEKVERPSYYLAQRGMGNHQSNYNAADPYTWRGGTVADILSKQEYMGHTVNFRTYKESYKDKRVKMTPKEDLVIFENTQEAIIDKETWERVQTLRKTIRRTDSIGKANPLTGLMFCADCGAKMYNHRGKAGNARDWAGRPNGKKRPDRDEYNCSRYDLGNQHYDKYCTTHLIRTAVVNELLLEAIKGVCDYALSNEAEFMAQVCSASEDRQEKAARSIRQRKQRNEKRTDELTRLIRKLYEDNVSGRLSDTLFEQMLRDFEAELSDLTEIVSQDQQELERISRETINAEKFLSLVRKYTDFSELTPAMINEFVEKILVHQAQGKGASRIQEIEIFFNFVGKVDIPHKEVELTEEEKAALAEQERRRAKKAEYNRRYMEKKRRQWKEQQEQEQAEQLPLAAEQKGEHIA